MDEPGQGQLGGAGAAAEGVLGLQHQHRQPLPGQGRGRDEAVRNRARDLARQLSEENGRRQEQESAILTEARRVIDRDPQVGSQNILIVAGEGWHRGVIGIVASKLVKSTGRPAVVIAMESKKMLMEILR